MARPRKAETMTTISVRLPSQLLTEVDSYSDRIRAETRLLNVTRTDAVRMLIQLGLETASKKGSKLR